MFFDQQISVIFSTKFRLLINLKNKEFIIKILSIKYRFFNCIKKPIKKKKIIIQKRHFFLLSENC